PPLQGTSPLRPRSGEERPRAPAPFLCHTARPATGIDAMDFSQFDQRHYPTVGAREGYTEWAATYEDTVLDLMDKRLLSRLQSVSWAQASHTLDLACGTGRTGAW